MDDTLSAQIPTPTIQEAHKRAFYIIVVALYPILFSAILALLVFHFGGFKQDVSVGSSTEFASIDTPDKNSLGRANPIIANGNIFKVPENKIVYLVERKEGLYWPKKRLQNNTKQWEWKLYASEGRGYKFHFVVLAVDTDGSSTFDEWFVRAQKTGQYPGMAPVSGSQELAVVRIVRN